MSRPIGLFGGTFDPVHNGHLRLAETALHALDLESIRWVPTGRPGHREAPYASAQHRLAMLKLALEGHARFSLDEAEIHSDAPGFTIDTLRRLRAEKGEAVSLVFLIGGDQLMGLDRWRDWKQLFDLAHFAAAQRPGHPVSAAAMPAELAQEYSRRHAAAAELGSRPSGLICLFAMTPLDISSTAVRDAIASGCSPRDAVPPLVLDYIESNGLYRQGTAAL